MFGHQQCQKRQAAGTFLDELPNPKKFAARCGEIAVAKSKRHTSRILIQYM